MLDTAINVFNQQLQTSIASGKTDLTLVLSTLNYLNPFRAMNSGRLGFAWITWILKSGYTERDRYLLAGKVVQLLGNEVDTHPPKYFSPNWVPPLLGFLSLSEKFHTRGHLPVTGFTTLRILSCHVVDGDFGPTLLPILASTLLQDHPLQSRCLALKIFHRFTPGWFSRQMENVSDEDRGNLLRAVGDPFQFPDLPLQYGQPEGTADCKPMMAAVALVEFVSSDLWRNHLSRSNFNSFEEVVSTEEGRGIALGCMLSKATHTWSEFLRTPTKIVAAIRRLEELQCLNTAEVAILWAWTTGVVNMADCDGWRLIERVTLEFYQTHGIGRLTALTRHVITNNKAIEGDHMEFLLQCIHHEGSSRRSESPSAITKRAEKHLISSRVSRVCQLRRLHHLFGCGPVTWEEMVAAEGVGGEVDMSSGRSMTIPILPTD